MMINYSRNAEEYDERHCNILDQAVIQEIADIADLRADHKLLDFAAGTGGASLGSAKFGFSVTSFKLPKHCYWRVFGFVQ